MSGELSERVAADIGEILERTGFSETPPVLPERLMTQVDLEQMDTSMQGIAPAFIAVGQALAAAMKPLVDWAREHHAYMMQLGLVPDAPPQYRHTRHGRVPRLTPVMRQRQHELRLRSGRR